MQKLNRVIFIITVSFFFQFCGKTENTQEKKDISLNKTGTASSRTHINLATLEWLPYVGEELENKGYVTELVKEVFQSQGITADIEFLPFARILSMAKEGRIDGYFPEYMNEENKQIYYYSDPYPGGDIGFVKLKKRCLRVRFLQGNERFSFSRKIQDRCCPRICQYGGVRQGGLSEKGRSSQ